MKEQDYLPAIWIKNYRCAYDFSKIPIQDLRILADDCHAGIIKDRVMKRYANINKMAYECVKQTGSQDMILNEIDIYSMMKMWNRNQLAYRLDADFLNELLKTDSILLSKDAWKYLPCNLFYLDISANKELCEELSASGLFVLVTEGIAKELWQLHVLRIKDKDTGYFDCFYVWNRDEEIQVDETLNYHDMLKKLHEEIAKNCDLKGRNFKEKLSPKLSAFPETLPTAKEYYLLIQILTYLSSTEPDIRDAEPFEDEPEKITPKPFKKGKSKPVQPKKVKPMDIGVAFGTAFRKWTQSKTASSGNGESGKKVRPHYCRAHWHSYWYGKKDEERIKRPKWIAGYFTGQGETENQPVVIHDVK